MATAYGKENVVLSTDDSEIAAAGEAHAIVHRRAPELADDRATLDEVAVDVARWLTEMKAQPSDILVTVQPTSPFLSAKRIDEAVALLLAGAKSVVSVRDDRHLRWTTDDLGKPHPLFEKRVNRQWLPVTLAETGGVVACRIGDIVAAHTRIQEPMELLHLDPYEALDIDDHADWAVAEYLAARKRIIIRADASPQLGMGHVYRASAIAHELASHHLTIVTQCENENQLGASFLSSLPFDIHAIAREELFLDYLGSCQPDIVITDLLDTDESYMRHVKSLTKMLVTLEDFGRGSLLADIVINDLYTDTFPKVNHWYGVQNAILAPQFEALRPRDQLPTTVEHVLVTYGGTDPNDLTRKALVALQEVEYSGQVTVVLGPGYGHPKVHPREFQLQGELLQNVKNMAALMREADLAVTSAGRTVTELMTFGVPTLVMCQNLRELRHTHASGPFGVINLGLGEHVSAQALAEHLKLLLENSLLREEMRNRALASIRGRSNATIVGRIIGLLTTSNAVSNYE
jgi:spore coat polysaccharide biosynthesis predicted glycosyltransferase SpsG